jgi:hypothetical protein
VWATQLVLVRDRNIDINYSEADKKIADKKKTLIIFSRERAGDIKKTLSTTAISRELFGFTPSLPLMRD